MTPEEPSTSAGTQSRTPARPSRRQRRANEAAARPVVKAWDAGAAFERDRILKLIARELEAHAADPGRDFVKHLLDGIAAP